MPAPVPLRDITRGKTPSRVASEKSNNSEGEGRGVDNSSEDCRDANANGDNDGNIEGKQLMCRVIAVRRAPAAISSKIQAKKKSAKKRNDGNIEGKQLMCRVIAVRRAPAASGSKIQAKKKSAKKRKQSEAKCPKNKWKRGPCSRASFDMQLNGGRSGKNKKLHDHGFVLLDGIIKCTLCNKVIHKHENMARHTENASHAEAYRRKITIPQPPSGRRQKGEESAAGGEDPAKSKALRGPCSLESFIMQLNGGRNGKGQKLHNHGFDLIDGRVHCSLCFKEIAKHENMARHANSASHMEAYRRKCENALVVSRLPTQKKPPKTKRKMEPIEINGRRMKRGPCSVESFNLQLNGGRSGKNKRLHDHGFELIDGVINCTLCDRVIVKHENMARHTETEGHLEAYQRKCEGLLGDDDGGSEGDGDSGESDGGGRNGDGHGSDKADRAIRPMCRGRCSRKSFNMQLNGGQKGNNAKLHDHGFELIDGTIHCTLCDRRIVKHENMARHAKTAGHLEAYRKKCESVSGNKNDGGEGDGGKTGEGSGEDGGRNGDGNHDDGSVDGDEKKSLSPKNDGSEGDGGKTGESSREDGGRNGDGNHHDGSVDGDA